MDEKKDTAGLRIQCGSGYAFSLQMCVTEEELYLSMDAIIQSLVNI